MSYEDLSGEGGNGDMVSLGDSYYPNVAGAWGYQDVSGYYDTMGIWNPFSAARGVLRRVPIVNRIPGFRPRRAPPRMPLPAPRPPLPAMETRPTAELRSSIGLPTVVWGATDSFVQTSQIRMEESFRPERLIITEIRTGTAVAGATRVVGKFVGSQTQSPSIASPEPVEMYAANATYAALDWQIAFRGTAITLQLDRTAAPGAGNSVTVTIGIYGQWIR